MTTEPDRPPPCAVPYEQLRELAIQHPDSPCWTTTHLGRPCGPACLAFATPMCDESQGAGTRQMRVVVCGSISHPNRIDEAVSAQRASGRTVIAFPFRDGSVSEAEHAVTWRTHIENADLVVAVAKPDGSFGESTQAEMDFAAQVGTQVEIPRPFRPPSIREDRPMTTATPNVDLLTGYRSRLAAPPCVCGHPRIDHYGSAPGTGGSPHPHCCVQAPGPRGLRRCRCERYLEHRPHSPSGCSPSSEEPSPAARGTQPETEETS